MKSYSEYMEATKDRSSNKVEAIGTLVDAIRGALDKYDIATRQFVWDHLMSPKGKDLMAKIVRNPKVALSDSEFTKLVTNSKK
jgi:hypothetical protein